MSELFYALLCTPRCQHLSNVDSRFKYDAIFALGMRLPCVARVRGCPSSEVKLLAVLPERCSLFVCLTWSYLCFPVMRLPPRQWCIDCSWLNTHIVLRAAQTHFQHVSLYTVFILGAEQKSYLTGNASIKPPDNETEATFWFKCRYVPFVSFCFCHCRFMWIGMEAHSWF